MLYNALGIKHLASIHGDKSQEQRNNIIEDFRKSILRIVVATDVAARGLGMLARTRLFCFVLFVVVFVQFDCSPIRCQRHRFCY
jgi:superfamily II DNA/RNA helicase